jgi:hypothetical protein
MTTPQEQTGTAWEIDDAEIVHRIIQTGVDAIEGITEAFQNAIDSVLPPSEESTNMTREQVNALPNEITIQIPSKKEREKDNVVCVLKDNGLSIAKDYDYDINKFIKAAKGTSPKRKNPWSRGRKGVGMFQFLRLADRIEIVSQDTEHKGLIYRFEIYWGMKRKTKFPFFSEVEYYKITPENQKKYKILTQGTVLTFYNPTEETKEISNLAEEATERIKDTFGLVMARNPNLIVRINGIPQQPPEFLKHNEEPIIPELGITGNIHEDKEGIGVLKIIGEGGVFIQDFPFYPRRRCSGYLVCEKWIPDTGRKLVNKDKHWKESVNEINKYMERFRKVQYADQDQKSDKKIKEMIENFSQKVLSQYLPKAIISGAQDKKKIKQPGTGHINPGLDEDKTPGYRQAKEKEGDEYINEKEKETRKPHTRDNTHQQQVGVQGTDNVMRVNNHTDYKQERHPLITFDVKEFGPDIPLMEIVTETDPWVLYINKQNPLYDQKIRTARRINEYKQHTAEQYAMLCMKIKQEQGKLPSTMGLDEFKKELEKHTLAILEPETGS